MPTLGRRLIALRVAAILVYLGLLALWTALVGIPSDPLSLFVALWVATIAWRAGAPLRSHVAFARDWSLPVLFLLGYSYSYGLIYLLRLPVHYEPAIAVDRWLGGGEILAQRLQDAICGGPCAPQGATWLDAVLTTTYLSHFLTAWVPDPARESPFSVPDEAFLRVRARRAYYAHRDAAPPDGEARNSD